MIILFPMLTSKSVSPHVIPGICKTLEKFVLVYKMDDVLTAAGIVSASFAAAKAGVASTLFRHNESEDLLEAPNIHGQKEIGANNPQHPDYDTAEWNPEKGSRGWYDQKEKIASTKDKFESGRKKELEMSKMKHDLSYDIATQKMNAEKNKDAKHKAQLDALSDLQSDFKIDINFPQTQTMTIEPTWVTLSTKRGAVILGIKVIAFPIDSDNDIVKLMTNDLSRSGFDLYFERYKRKMSRMFSTVARKFKIPFMGGSVINDDPREAIVFAKTEHGSNIFTCLNYSDINRSRLMFNAINVSKLFKLGWTSFITADDINKRAIFCMNEFSGMCSTVPYSFLHASVSRDIAKAYTDLDDIKNSASPFFRLSVPKKKVLGESLAFQKLDSYLKVLNGD